MTTPDLTDLRAIVARAEQLMFGDADNPTRRLVDPNEAEWVGLAFEALTAAIHLCRNHPSTGSENP